MKIIPLGAAGGEVTGSCYLVQGASGSVLVDCGMFQGGKSADEFNAHSFLPDPRDVKAVLLTHGHLDHVGRLPILFKKGYAGPVYCTPATQDLTALILRDSAKLQAQDAERSNRKRQRAGLDPVEPLYTPQDVENTLPHFKTVPYQSPVRIADEFEATFAEAGHMLGSASIRLQSRGEGSLRTVVFSGDLGPKDAPILKDSEPFTGADMVVLESTYGDRNHRPLRDTIEEFLRVVKQTVARRGKILVPTFAVGRAQLLMMIMAHAFRERIVEPFPLFLDSPMAIEAWNIYRHHEELFDDDMNRFMNRGSLERDLSTLQFSATADESRAINDVPGPCMVMAGAGMCTGGRILHHLKQNLWRPETHVMMVGYQARGSLGRLLVEGVSHVRMFGEEIIVRAQVHTLGGFSAHAGQTDLLAWFKPMASSNPRVVLTHGEKEPRGVLAGLLRKQGLSVILPELQDVIAV